MGNELYERIKEKMSFDEAPECLAQLNAEVQDGPIGDAYVSVDEFADSLGVSRQTIFNYIGDKTIKKGVKEETSRTVISIEHNLIPLSIQMVQKQMREQIFEQETNLIFFNREGLTIDEIKLLVQDKFPDSTCISLKDVNDTASDLMYELLPIDKIAGKAQELAEAEISVFDSRFADKEVLSKKRIEEQAQQIYQKAYNDWLRLLNETDIPDGAVDCSISDVKKVLGYMAQQKAVKTGTLLLKESISNMTQERIDACNKYSPCVEFRNGSQKVGSVYEKLYRKAYRQLLGESIREGIGNCQSQKHILVTNCKIAGRMGEDMRIVDKLFGKMKISYHTVLMGYDSMDDITKSFLKGKVSDMESKQGCSVEFA